MSSNPTEKMGQKRYVSVPGACTIPDSTLKSIEVLLGRSCLFLNLNQTHSIPKIPETLCMGRKIKALHHSASACQ